MAGNLGTLAVYLTAHTGSFKREVYAAEQTIDKFSGRLERFAKYGLAGLGAGLAMSAREFYNFDAQMTKSLAIMSNVNEAARAELSMTARKLSTEFNFSAEQIAQGYFYLFSAGKTFTEAQKEMVNVTRFAQAGQFDLATATTLLLDSQRALGLSSKNLVEDQKQLVRISDVLTKANTLANASVQNFAQALTNDAAAAMRNFNVPLEEGVAVLAAYAEQGIKGEDAGSMFGRFLRLLIPSANENIEAFEQLNIRVFNASGNLRNLADIARDMEVAFSGMSISERGAALEMLGFEKKMQGAVFPIIGASDRIRDFEEQLDAAGGTVDRFSENSMRSLSARFGLLASTIQYTVVESLNFSGATQSMMEMAESLTQTIKDMDSPTKALTVNLIAASAAVGAVALAAKSLGIISLAGSFITMSSVATASAITLFRNAAALVAITKAGGGFLIFIELYAIGIRKWHAAMLAAKMGLITTVGLMGQLAIAAGVAVAAFKIGEWIGEIEAVKNALSPMFDMFTGLEAEKRKSAELDRKIEEARKKRQADIASGKINPNRDVKKAEQEERAKRIAETRAAIETKGQQELAKLEEGRAAALDRLYESRMTQEERVNKLIQERDQLEKSYMDRGISKQERLRRETALIEKQYELERAQDALGRDNERERLKKQRELEREASAKTMQTVQISLVRGSMEAVKAEAQARLDAQGIEISRQIVKNTERTAKATEGLLKKNNSGGTTQTIEIEEAI